jgi:hypothetical protein
LNIRKISTFSFGELKRNSQLNSTFENYETRTKKILEVAQDKKLLAVGQQSSEVRVANSSSNIAIRSLTSTENEIFSP